MWTIELITLPLSFCSSFNIIFHFIFLHPISTPHQPQPLPPDPHFYVLHSGLEIYIFVYWVVLFSVCFIIYINSDML